MTKYVIDTGILGKMTHPNANEKHRDLIFKLIKFLENGHEIVIPEISDYELRREFLLQKRTKSIKKLDEWEETVTYLPLHTRMIKRASQLWADIREKGKPTADKHALDGDVILVAQAEHV